MRNLKLVLIGTAALVSGCAYMAPATTPDVTKNVAQTQQLAAQQREQTKPVPAFTVSPGFYIGAKPAQLSQASLLPASFDQHIGHSQADASLSEAARYVYLKTNVPVTLSYDLVIAENRSMTMSGQSGASTGQFVLRPSDLSYDGTLKGYLDYLASMYGVFWRYRNGEIQFYLTDTRTYFLRTMPLPVQEKIAVSNSADTNSNSGDTTGSGSASGSQSTTYSMNLNEWSDVQNNIKTMLDTNGQVVVNPGAGTVTVTDEPPILDRVASYLSSVNSRLSQQVAVTVKVYSLTLNRSRAQQFNPTLAFQNLAQEYGISVTPISPLSSLTGAEALSGVVLPGTGNALSQWNGTTLLFNMLRQYGALTAITSGQGIGMDNQPIPLHDLAFDDYLKSVQVTPSLSAGSGPTAALNPGRIVTGFSATFIPHVLDDNRIMLVTQVNIAGALPFTDATSNGSYIALSHTTSRSFAQTVTLKSGSTLVLAGLLRDSHTADDNAGLISDGWDKSASHTMVFVVITVNHMQGA